MTVDYRVMSGPSMNVIDQCRECGGQLTVLSLDRQERMRRRIGQSLVTRCNRCSCEVTVVKRAWMTFVEAKRKQSRAKEQLTKGQLQLNLF